MRNIIRTAFAAILIVAAAVSCRKQAVVTIDTNVIEAPSSGLTRAVGINTNYPWDAVVSDSWIVLHNTTGNPGDAVMGVCVISNTSGEDREGTITITCEEIVTTIKVRQSSNDALNITGDEAEITYVGGEIIVPVEAGSEYEMISPVDWITDGGTRTLNQYQHAITVALNETEEDREAVVTFRSSTGIEKTFYVKQLGFSPTVVFTYTGEELVIPEIKGEQGFFATVTWGDGTSEEYAPGLVHKYPVAGEYNVVIIGKGLTGYKMADVDGIGLIDVTEF